MRIRPATDFIMTILIASLISGGVMAQTVTTTTTSAPAAQMLAAPATSPVPTAQIPAKTDYDPEALPPAPAADTTPKAPDVSKVVIQNDEDAHTPTAVLAATLKLLDQMPPDVRQSLLDEGAHAKEYCETNGLLSSFYDCGCFSLRMIQTRIDSGPNQPFINLIMNAEYKECVSLPAAAGYGYKRCDMVMTMQEVTTPQLKKICECTSRAMATLFGQNPVPNDVYINGYFNTALSQCRTQNGF